MACSLSMPPKSDEISNLKNHPYRPSSKGFGRRRIHLLDPVYMTGTIIFHFDHNEFYNRCLHETATKIAQKIAQSEVIPVARPNMFRPG